MLMLPAGVTQTANDPILSGFDCSFVVGGSSGSCAFVLGTPDTGTNLLQVNNGNTFDGVLSFNLNMAPLPLPASLWLMMGGLGGLVLFRRRLPSKV